jgi:hypothetical protein
MEIEQVLNSYIVLAFDSTGRRGEVCLGSEVAVMVIRFTGRSWVALLTSVLEKAFDT